MKDAKLHFVRTKQKKKFEDWKRIKKEARTEVGRLTKRDLFMFGLGVYLGEGRKGYNAVEIMNSDPHIIRLAIKWFSNVCSVPHKNFSIAVHLYPDTDVDETLRFWQKQTGIPLTRFGKTQIDRRKNKLKTKHNKLPYGTARLIVRAMGNPQLGVQLKRRILAWMDYVMNNARV